MPHYAQLRKLDLETLERLQAEAEGLGPNGPQRETGNRRRLRSSKAAKKPFGGIDVNRKILMKGMQIMVCTSSDLPLKTKSVKAPQVKEFVEEEPPVPEESVQDGCVCGALGCVQAPRPKPKVTSPAKSSRPINPYDYLPVFPQTPLRSSNFSSATPQLHNRTSALTSSRTDPPTVTTAHSEIPTEILAQAVPIYALSCSDPDSDDSEYSATGDDRESKEYIIKQDSISKLIEAQYDDDF